MTAAKTAASKRVRANDPGAKNPGRADAFVVEEVAEFEEVAARRERLERRRQIVSPRSAPPESGSIKQITPRTETIEMDSPGSGAIPVTRASRRAAEDAAAGNTHGRRAASPRGLRRKSEMLLGRAVSNRRVWGAALAVTMVLVVPSTAALNHPAPVADAGLTSGGDHLRAYRQFPADHMRAWHRTRHSATATTAATAAATAAATKAAATAAATKAAQTAASSTTVLGSLSDARSHLGWPSGVYIPGSSPANTEAFGAWRGAKVDVVVDWGARSSWDDIVNPTWLYNAWKGTPYTKSFGVAPIPEGDSSATLAGCAAGSYNDKWRQFGANIKAAGLDSTTVIRLGWEFNGNWYKWAASNPAQFAGCWRQVVTTVRQVAPKLLWDWNVNRGVSSGLADATKAYPGDAYVDIVGVDSYDQYPGATNEASWQQQYTGPQGLKFWADFAKAHGKKISIPEWGVYPSRGSSSGGDNPFYIAKMEGFFKSLGKELAYESYFNESASYYGGSIYGAGQNPSAASEYKTLVGT
jgi:beta-mannanase